MAIGMPGVMELLVVLVMGTGLGIPLGVPPSAEDPVLAQVAPEQCLFYSTWSEMAVPDATSKNQTEQLLAEPEVKQFLSDVEQAIDMAVAKATANSKQSPNAVLLKSLPTLGKTIISKATAIFVQRFEMTHTGPEVTAGLVANLGDRAGAFRGTLKQLEQLMPGGGAHEVTIDGTAFRQLRPDPKAPMITWGLKGDYLIVGIGDQAVEGILKRMETPAPKWLAKIRDSYSIARRSTLSYLNVGALAELGAAAGGPAVRSALDATGVSSLGGFSSVTGLSDTGFVSESRLEAKGGVSGLIDLLAGEPLTADQLAPIPRDATVAAAFRLDASRLLQGLLDTVKQFEPRAAMQFEDGLDSFEGASGIPVRKGLLKSLGDVWTLHTGPQSGGLLTGWTLTVSLRDREKLERTHDKLLGFVQSIWQRQRRAPTIDSIKFDGQTLYTLNVPEQEFPFAPTWCITDKYLVIGVVPQTVKSFLVRKTTEGSLADVPAIAKALAGDQPPFAVAYQDTRTQFQTFYPALQILAQMGARQLRRQGIEINAASLPSAAAINPHLEPSIMLMSKTSSGIKSVRLSTYPGASIGASGPILVALLLPAVQSARGAARRTQSMNNLKQLALAMHNYHDTFRRFPAGYNVDKNGKPLLSWRVYLLPFVEQNQLYQQFHFDEPWDSPNNKKLIPLMPPAFRSPGSKAAPGKTVYLGNATADGVFVPGKLDPQHPRSSSGIGLRDIRDGTSNTIMIVEVKDSAAVIWTKPDDLKPDKKGDFPALIGARPEGFLAALCDGSVRLFSGKLDKKMVKAFLTRSGGEAVRE